MIPTLADSDSIGAEVYELLRETVQQRYGIVLEGRQEQVRSRLGGVARASGATSLDAYITAVMEGGNSEALSELVDRLTTNHTHFHREPIHFDVLADTALPPIIEARRNSGERDLRIWCAAASTGQEPYTLAMIVQELLGSEAASWKTDILATDISQSALDQARQGRYRELDVERLPPKRRRWFDGEGSHRFIRKELKRQVLYRRMNLLRPRYPFSTTFDVVFCRNVMIYFDMETRTEVVERMATVIRPGGWLFISLSETLPRREDLGFKFVQPGVYRRT